MPTSDERRVYTAANRLAWDQAAPVHARQRMAEWLQRFATPGYSCLDEVASGMLLGIGLQNTTVAQLCCNNGRDLISIVRLGARSGVGFDISAEFIAQAELLADVARVDCRFVCGDVYEIPSAEDAAFDLAYVSVGALGWLPDLPAFFAVARRLLRPGGWLAIYEMHPILDMLEDEHEDPPPLRHSYFRTEPYVEAGGLDYFAGSQYESAPTFWFHHRLADVIQGCLEAGFCLRSFHEHAHDISNVFAYLEPNTIKLPLCYTLTARAQ